METNLPREPDRVEVIRKGFVRRVLVIIACYNHEEEAPEGGHIPLKQLVYNLLGDFPGITLVLWKFLNINIKAEDYRPGNDGTQKERLRYFVLDFQLSEFPNTYGFIYLGLGLKSSELVRIALENDGPDLPHVSGFVLEYKVYPIDENSAWAEVPYETIREQWHNESSRNRLFYYFASKLTKLICYVGSERPINGMETSTATIAGLGSIDLGVDLNLKEPDCEGFESDVYPILTFVIKEFLHFVEFPHKVERHAPRPIDGFDDWRVPAFGLNPIAIQYVMSEVDPESVIYLETIDQGSKGSPIDYSYIVRSRIAPDALLLSRIERLTQHIEGSMALRKTWRRGELFDIVLKQKPESYKTIKSSIVKDLILNTKESEPGKRTETGKSLLLLSFMETTDVSKNNRFWDLLNNGASYTVDDLERLLRPTNKTAISATTFKRLIVTLGYTAEKPKIRGFRWKEWCKLKQEERMRITMMWRMYASDRIIQDDFFLNHIASVPQDSRPTVKLLLKKSLLDISIHKDDAPEAWVSNMMESFFITKIDDTEFFGGTFHELLRRLGEHRDSMKEATDKYLSALNLVLEDLGKTSPEDAISGTVEIGYCDFDSYSRIAVRRHDEVSIAGKDATYEMSYSLFAPDSSQYQLDILERSTPNWWRKIPLLPKWTKILLLDYFLLQLKQNVTAQHLDYDFQIWTRPTYQLKIRIEDNVDHFEPNWPNTHHLCLALSEKELGQLITSQLVKLADRTQGSPSPHGYFEIERIDFGEPKPVQPPLSPAEKNGANLHCWMKLLSSASISQLPSFVNLPEAPYPPKKPKPPGLYTSFDSIVSLACIDHEVKIEDSVVLKGVYTALVPVEKVYELGFGSSTRTNIIVWHVITKDRARRQKTRAEYALKGTTYKSNMDLSSGTFDSGVDSGSCSGSSAYSNSDSELGSDPDLDDSDIANNQEEDRSHRRAFFEKGAEDVILNQLRPLTISDIISHPSFKSRLKGVSVNGFLKLNPAILGWYDRVNVHIGHDSFKTRMPRPSCLNKWDRKGLQWNGVNIGIAAPSIAPIVKADIVFSRMAPTIQPKITPVTSLQSQLRILYTTLCVVYDVDKRIAWLLPLLNLFIHLIRVHSKSNGKKPTIPNEFFAMDRTKGKNKCFQEMASEEGLDHMDSKVREVLTLLWGNVFEHLDTLVKLSKESGKTNIPSLDLGEIMSMEFAPEWKTIQVSQSMSAWSELVRYGKVPMLVCSKFSYESCPPISPTPLHDDIIHICKIPIDRDILVCQLNDLERYVLRNCARIEWHKVDQCYRARTKRASVKKKDLPALAWMPSSHHIYEPCQANFCENSTRKKDCTCWQWKLQTFVSHDKLSRTPNSESVNNRPSLESGVLFGKPIEPSRDLIGRINEIIHINFPSTA